MAKPSENALVLRSVTGERELTPALAVRWRVFVEEQRVPPEEEHDALDADAVHMIAELDGEVVATGRMVMDAHGARLGRIAVLPEWRRQGIGGRIVAALEAEAARRGIREVALHAQTYVQELYDKLGYVVSGPAFIEAGINHVPMVKRL